MASLSALILLTTLSANPNDLELLQFTAPWCGPCRSMEPTIRRLADDGYPVRQVNIDQHPEIAQRYGVRPIPCFVLVEKGRELDRIVGATSYDRLVQMFRRVPARPSASLQGSPASASESSGDVVRAQSPNAGPAEGSDSRDGRWDRFARGQRQPDAFQQASGTDQHERPRQTAPPLHGRSEVEPSSPSLDPRARALQATVRLKVSDPDGHSFGSGTIVDVHGDEALVVTCGHVFRDSQGKGEIEVTLFLPSGEVKVSGHLLAFDADRRDIGLVFIRPGVSVVAAPVAGPAHAAKIGNSVFSVGCDRGASPTVRESRVTNVNRYLGPPNIESAGHPIDGRSGGGLFTAEGELIGVCNAADPADDEGVYAALPTIHWQLDQIGQSRIYDRAPGEHHTTEELASSDVPSANATQLTPLPELDDQPSNLSIRNASVTGSDRGVAGPEESELICILRSPENPNGRQLIVVKGPSRELVEHLRQQSQSRNSAAGTRVPRPLSSEMTALPRIAPPQQMMPEQMGRTEIVRGQNNVE